MPLVQALAMDYELSPGTYCAVELKVPRRTPSLIVPAGAIVFDRDGLHVLVVENGVAHSRKITEIRDLGTEVEVSDGVKQGDEVVLTPPVDLEDGSKVQVRADPNGQSSVLIAAMELRYASPTQRHPSRQEPPSCGPEREGRRAPDRAGCFCPVTGI
jgi:hypothetical protein